jgi:hypothetical protein
MSGVDELELFTEQAPQTETERLKKERRSMDKFLYEKNVEDLITEIKDLKKNQNVKKLFLKTWLN